ncbi:Centriole, cilia and spindle-associated protein [Channa argus]|uniref:Centriole, cilia and spindle-associated protein n=1 Tax=Channa argus TaxID=215402 RepID=A0A6G1P7W1_CHAAH|nr:Centriole, cilia and spindle-associated protein [Channa argus]
MVTKRIRSEYMKKFKDPKWETYSKCYEEMLKYRLTRRLLEYTHNPWFWSGSDSDSDSGGRSPPPPPTKNQVGSETSRDRTQAKLECERVGEDRPKEQQTRPAGSVPRIPLEEEEEVVPAAHGQRSQLDGASETRVPAKDEEEHRGSKEREANTGGPQPQQSKPTKSSQQPRHSQKVRVAPSRQSRKDIKERRHPFALYASGEKDADIAARKTHNVGAAASTTEIHESALRAKTRREVERQIQTQRTERRRAKSADLGKARKLVQPEFNPWLTEYMRCFSDRSR